MNASASLTAPSPGFGLGLRTPHYPDFLANSQRFEGLDWLEIITDNFMVEGGKPLVMLERIRRDYPMAMHGVAMSLGAPGGADLAYLKRVKTLADRVQPLWVSDHLCWIGPGPEQLHDLYPLPYTDEAARRVIHSIRQAQDVLQRRLVVENVSSYIDFQDSACSEWQFLSYIAQEADCLLLLDVNNIHVSSVNHGFSALDYLDGLPANRVQQIHLAGHTDHGDHLIDTHDHPVAAPVWQLYREACLRFGTVATMIERDDHIPSLHTLLDELAVARSTANEVLYATDLANPAQLSVNHQKEKEIGQITILCNVDGHNKLSKLQQNLATYILSPVERHEASLAHTLRSTDGVNSVQAPQRLGIYHHAYRARLAEVLADSFAKISLYMGSDTFEVEATAFAVAHPPLTRRLGRYGADLPAFLAERYPHNPELFELAQLDWDLRECFDGPDAPALDASGAARDSAQSWLACDAPLHPSVRLRTLTTNAVQLWKAIDDDHDVPAPFTLEAPRTLLVWRKGLQPHFQTLDAAPAQFIACLAEGQSILQACENLQTMPELAAPETLGGWLQAWLADGLLRGPPG